MHGYLTNNAQIMRRGKPELSSPVKYQKRKHFEHISKDYFHVLEGAGYADSIMKCSNNGERCTCPGNVVLKILQLIFYTSPIFYY